MSWRVEDRGCHLGTATPIPVEADLRRAQVKAAGAAGRNHNRRLLRGFVE
jgi:hypothetical protein